jgi:multiple sugar transport system substrate-binding protein
MRKSVIWLLTLVLSLSALLAACSSGNGGQSDGERTLRIGIMYGDDTNEYTRKQYTDNYELKMRGAVKVEMVPAINYDEEMQLAEEADASGEAPENYLDREDRAVNALLGGDNPVDVLLFEWADLDRLGKLARDNKLMQLEPLIADHRFDITDFNENVLNAIREAGDGNLYGLAPYYTANALFYNKDIFEQAGVPVPQDGMTWEQIFDLARRVSSGEGEERIYGFSNDRWSQFDASMIINTMGAQENLRVVDPTGTQMTINTPRWQEIFAEVYNLQQEQVWSPADNSGSYSSDQDQFILGKKAMVIADYNYVAELQNYVKNGWYGGQEEIQIPQWDVVTVPVSKNAPDIGLDFSLRGMVAINAQATNKEDAWDYLAFVNGEQWAKTMSRSDNYSLLSRTSASAEQTINIGAFSQLKSLPTPSEQEMRMISDTPGYTVAQLAGDAYLSQVLTGEMTIPEALAAWEEEGNKMLKFTMDEADAWMDAYYAQKYTNSPDGGISVSVGL